MKQAWYENDNVVYFVAMLASVLLSAWNAIQETVINPDAICYLLTAEEITRTNLSSAMHLCGQALAWPFYPMLINGVVQLSAWSYPVAAYVLDGFFSLISVVTFIAIVKSLGGRRSVLWFAAIVILLSHEFNSVRQYIIRDHGFWAFYLISFYWFTRYLQHPLLKNALLWSVSLLVAMLFRIEAAVFLLCLPFFVFFRVEDTLKQRLASFLRLHALSLLMAVILMGWLYLHPLLDNIALGRLYGLGEEIQHGFLRIVTRYHTTKAAFIHHVLPHESSRDASLVLFLTIIAWYGLSLIGNLSWIYSALFIYTWRTRAANFSYNALIGIGAYLSVNFFITSTFFAENLFLSKRYLLAFSLVLMFWVPFGLARLWEQQGRQLGSSQHRARLAIGTVIVAVIFSALGGIFDFGYSKAYIRQGAQWVAQEVPQNTHLYTNSRQLLYYSNYHHADFFQYIKQYKAQNKIAAEWWKQYDYVALRIVQGETHPWDIQFRKLALEPTKTFNNKRGDRVIIYRIPHEYKISQVRVRS